MLGFVYLYSQKLTTMEKYITGIYSITNLVNGKRYIGKSLSIHSRWSQHRKDLKNNKHYNAFLQRAWNKYGGENFKFEVVEKCEKEYLHEKEIYWIEQFKTLYANYGYNLHDVSADIIKLDEIKNLPHLKIYQIDENNQVVKIWNSLHEVAEFNNTTYEKMDKHIYGYPKGNNQFKVAHKGFIWVKEDKYDAEFDYNQNSRISHPILAVNNKNEIIKKYNDVKELALELGIKELSASATVSKQTPYRGLLYIREKYFDATKDYFIKNPTTQKENYFPARTIQNIATGELYHFTSFKQPEKDLGLSGGKLYELLRGWRSEGGGKKKQILSYKGWKAYIN